MSDATRGHRAGLPACAVAAVLLITACSSGPGEQNADPAGATEPPEPSPAATSEDTSSESSSSDEADADSTDGANEQDSDTLAPTASGGPEAMEASDPVSVSIPEIDLESELMDLGLQDNGMVEVPPLRRRVTSWLVHPRAHTRRSGPLGALGTSQCHRWWPRGLCTAARASGGRHHRNRS